VIDSNTRLVIINANRQILAETGPVCGVPAGDFTPDGVLCAWPENVAEYVKGTIDELA